MSDMNRYRVLEPGDVVRRGDEWFDPETRQWNTWWKSEGPVVRDTWKTVWRRELIELGDDEDDEDHATAIETAAKAPAAEQSRLMYENRIIDRWLDATYHMQLVIHNMNRDKGFWEDRDHAMEMEEDAFTRMAKMEALALIHSEVSEAVEGIRKGDVMDDHCPQRTMEACEMADIIIRILDYCEGFDVDMMGAMFDKLEYNRNRPYKHGKKA